MAVCVNARPCAGLVPDQASKEIRHKGNKKIRHKGHAASIRHKGSGTRVWHKGLAQGFSTILCFCTCSMLLASHIHGYSRDK